MTTYSKETALYDTGAIKNGVDDAATKATGYITDVSSDGIFVHTEDSPSPTVPETTGNYGVHISDDVDIINDGKVVASYGSTATVGQNANGYSRTEITGDGIDFKRKNGTNDVVMAHIGYASGASATGKATNPYYTFGTRASDTESTRGNWSVAEGRNTTASGYCSHSEGTVTTASGALSHAEGDSTTASGERSHAEGRRSTASGDVSHAEGYFSEVNGYSAHVEGYATKASGHMSHVIGMFNKEDPSYYVLTTDSYVHSDKTYYTYDHDSYTPVSDPTDDQISTYYEHLDFAEDFDYDTDRIKGHAFIIGNGLATNVRSNAFTVDWNGDVHIYLETDGTSPSDASTGKGTDRELLNTITALGWTSAVIV